MARNEIHEVSLKGGTLKRFKNPKEVTATPDGWLTVRTEEEVVVYARGEWLQVDVLYEDEE